MSFSDVVLLLSLLGGAIYGTFSITYKITAEKKNDESLPKK